ncbi:WD40-repeat-containing domain protein, partial [Cyathus striatus]
VNVLKFSPTGEYLASGSEDGLVIIYGVNAGDVLHRIQMHSPVISLAWDLAHRCKIYCRCLCGTFYINDFNIPGSEILTGLRDAPGYSIEVSRSGQLVALAVGPEIHIATKLTSKHFTTTNILPKPDARSLENDDNEDTRIRGRCLHLINNDTKLIVTYLNHGIVCWNLTKNVKLWRITPAFRFLGYSSLSQDHQYILISHLEGGMAVYSIDKLQFVKKFHTMTNKSCNEPVAAIFLNNGRHVACGSHNGCISIWNVRSGVVLQTL